MAGQLCFDVHGKGRGSRLDVASPLIKTSELFTEVDDKDVHEATSKGAAVAFGRVHEQRSRARVLAPGIDCQQPEISASVVAACVFDWARLDINAADDNAFTF